MDELLTPPSEAVLLSQLRVLVVEAVPDALVELCLCLHGQVLAVAMSLVATLQDEDVARFGPHIVLLEAGADDAGLELVPHLHRTWPGIGLILLIEPGCLEQRLRGYAMGADHCLDRRPDEEELTSAMQALMRRLSALAAPWAD
ncbi:response regulator transcription factor [Stutzerimonas azotifigens]|uniref:hypothetical protein n=1 Tax=Stutzerimonas azotifigens TaxID=291995 RepID=UPI00040FFDB3|nr:hypothetical protein [Stutzerimonas azotifigens]